MSDPIEGLQTPHCRKHGILTLQGICPACVHELTKMEVPNHLRRGLWALDCAEAVLGNIRPTALLGAPEWKTDHTELEHQERSAAHLGMYLSIATEELTQAELAEGDRLERWLRRNFRKGWTLAVLGWAAAIILGLGTPDPGQTVVVVVALVVACGLVVFRIVGGSKLW